MTYKIRMASLVCALLIETTCYPTYNREHYTQRRSSSQATEDILWPVVGFFGAVTGVFALGHWLGWWSESDEQLLHRVTCQQDEIKAYEPMLHYYRAYDQRAQSVDEPLLYQLALSKRESVSIDTYISNVKACVKKTASLVYDMEKRSVKLKKENDWHRVRDICCHFELTAEALQTKTKELKAMLSYMMMHVSYFKLFEQEDKVRGAYVKGLQLIEQYDEYSVTRELRAWIMSRYSGSFALVEFIKKIKTDIALLEKAATYPAYNYAVRIGYARDLIDRLYYMHKSIVSDGEYTRMLADYERAQREKERLQLERDRIHVEERKAQAREREAAAKEREVRAQETKNALKAAELADRYLHDRYR